ncbi:MAG: hypothetical protein ACOYES_09740 [Bacillota bacterium]|jgi:hypothetical protein
MYALLQDGFVRDVVGVLIITVFVGSVAAATVSAAADRFFEDTVSGIVGDYGEYDLIIHVRQEACREAARALEQTLRQDFPGARLKQSVTVLSRANFFVALPHMDEVAVTRLIRAATEVPGFAGYTIVLEPKVTVSGVGARVAPIIRPQLAAIEGVRFTLKDGGNIHLVCDSGDSARAVAQTAESILRRYHLVDVRPEGAAASSDDRQSLIDRVLEGDGGSSVHDVTADGAAQEARELGRALREMKRFIEAWAPQAVITLEDADVQPDESLVMSATPRRRGSAVGDGDTVVVLTEVSGSAARGIVVNPDVSAATGELTAYAVDGGVVGSRVGAGRLILPGHEVGSSLEEASAVLGHLGEATDAMLEATHGWEQALDAYETAIDSLIRLQRALERVGVGVGTDPDRVRIDPASVRSLAELTSKALQAIRTLETAAEAAAMFTSHYDPLLSNLRLWLSRLDSFARKLETVQSAASGAGDVAALLNEMSGAAAGILSTLQELDAAALGEQLKAARSDLDSLAGLDVEGLSKQLEAVQSRTPDFSGEGAARSIELIDQFIQEQQESSGKIELLVESDEPQKQLTTVIEKAAGTGAAVYILPPGVVQPGVRSEVRALLKSVKGTISGLAACAVVLLALILDHSTVIAGARAMAMHGEGVSHRDVPAAYGYGACVGALLLGTIAAITRATLASLGFPAFALLGTAMGLLITWAAPRLSPVGADEVEACMALGLSPSEVMREIVVPAGKPGMLSLLNRPRLVFGDTPSSGAPSKEGASQCSEYAT